MESPLVEHSLEQRQGKKANFRREIVRFTRGNLDRQVGDGMEITAISDNPTMTVLNRKGEWGQNLPPQLTIDDESVKRSPRRRKKRGQGQGEACRRQDGHGAGQGGSPSPAPGRGGLRAHALPPTNERAVQQKPQIEVKVPVKETTDEGPAKVVEENIKLSEAHTDAEVRKLAFF